MVEGPWSDDKAARRGGRLRADLEMFVDGSVVSIADDPYKKPKAAYMARVDPPRDEVFDIRSRDPKPGVRVLGCFADKDIFVALAWDFRENLGGPASREWRDFIERSKAEWRKLFNPYPPHKGATLHDYASNIILV